MSFSSAKVACPHDTASTTSLFPYNFHGSLPLFLPCPEKWHSMKIARKFLASVIFSGHALTRTEKVSTPTGCADEKKNSIAGDGLQTKKKSSPSRKSDKNDKHHD